MKKSKDEEKATEIAQNPNNPSSSTPKTSELNAEMPKGDEITTSASTPSDPKTSEVTAKTSTSDESKHIHNEVFVNLYVIFGVYLSLSINCR